MPCWVRGSAWLLGILLPVSGAVGGSDPSAAVPADTVEIARVIDASVGWFATKDFDLLARTFADDADFFIFHPDSRGTIHGAGAFREFSASFHDPDLTYVRHEIRDLAIHRSAAGETAWFSALLDDCSANRGEESCWRDCRWTGVLERRAGFWVIVQMHFSFAEDVLAAKFRRTESELAQRVFAGYPEMRSAVVELYGQQRYTEAAAILAGAVARYPDHVMANTFNLALMYASLGDADEAVRALEDGHRRGVFYGIWSFDGEPWVSLGDHAGFRACRARNEVLIAEAQRRAVLKVEVATPTGYEPGRAYPLFIALHGGGENLDQFRPHWTSPHLRADFIVAYVQSSQVAAMDGYHWQDDAITRRELRQALDEVKALHTVDPRRIVVGGFSSGGYGSLVTVLDGSLPAAGFVVLCPEVPADQDADAVAAAARRGVRSTLLTTERDGRVDLQRQFRDRLAAGGIDVRWVVTPDIGHWYPNDLAALIDTALAHIEGEL